MKFVKRVLLTIIVVIGLGLAGLWVWFNGLDKKVFVAEQITAAAGVKAHLDGAFTLSLWPSPRIEIGQITLDAHDGDLPLFAAENIMIETTLRDFFTGGLAIKRLSIDNPQLSLVRSVRNVPNWEPKRKRRGASRQGSPLTMRSLGQIALNNMTLNYKDNYTGQSLNLTEGSLKIDGFNPDRTVLNMSALIGEQPVSYQGDLSLLSGDVTGFLDLAENRIRLDGTLSAGGYNGWLEVDGPSLLVRLYDLLNLPEAQRHYHAPIHLQGNVRLTAQESYLEDIQLRLTPQTSTPVTVQVNGHYQQGDKQLDLLFREPLDLASFGLCQETAAQPQQSFTWPEEKLDVSPLAGIIGRMTIRLSQGFTCAAQSFDFAEIDIASTGKQLEITKATLQKRDGFIRATGNMAVARPHRSQLNITVEALPIEAFINQPKLTAPLDGAINLTWRGTTVKSWIDGLKGDIALTSDPIAHSGIATLNVIQLMSAGQLGGRTLPQSGAFALNGQIDKGVLRIADSGLTADRFRADLTGKVDLIRLVMNLKMMPESDDGLLEVPVLIKGSVFKPSVTADAAAIVRTKASDIGDAIGGKVGDVIGDILGGDNDSAPAVDQVRERLFNLLGGN